MSKKQKTRRTGHFGEGQRDGREVDGERMRVSPSRAIITCPTNTAQREPYPKAEADRRQREARHRIERQREQRQAARYFRELSGVVRRV